MPVDLIETQAGAMLLGASIVRVMAWAASYHGRLLRRTKQVLHANELLREHYENLEKFVNDDRVPADLKKMLIGFSDACSDKTLACELVKSMLENDKPKHSSFEVNEIMQSVDDLHGRYPELAALFDQAISCALMAMILRWDETAEMFDQLVSRLVSNPRREIALAARVAQSEQLQSPQVYGPGHLVPA